MQVCAHGYCVSIFAIMQSTCPPSWSCLCKIITNSFSLPPSPSLPPSFSLCTNAYHSPVSGPSCQCSIMALHELSVRQPLTTKSWNRLVGEMMVLNAAAVSCRHSLITKLLYLMPSGNRNDFLSCYLYSCVFPPPEKHIINNKRNNAS